MSSGIHKVGVIGIGLMGSGIAQVAAAQGFDTVVVDVTAAIVQQGMDRIRESLRRLSETHEKAVEPEAFLPAGSSKRSVFFVREHNVKCCSTATW